MGGGIVIAFSLIRGYIAVLTISHPLRRANYSLVRARIHKSSLTHGVASYEKQIPHLYGLIDLFQCRRLSGSSDSSCSPIPILVRRSEI